MTELVKEHPVYQCCRLHFSHQRIPLQVGGNPSQSVSQGRLIAESYNCITLSQGNLLPQVIQQVNHGIRGIIRGPGFDRYDLKPDAEALLEHLRGISHIAFNDQTPILFRPEFFIGRDFKPNRTDRLTLGITELKADNKR
jgi:hypothetical protein